MPRIQSLSILTTAEGKAYLAELYGKVIENVEMSLISGPMKNRDLSGDPEAGSVEAKRFANATSQAYGTARAAGAGNKVKELAVTVAIDVDKEIVEELEEKDIKLYGVDGVMERRARNHVQRMEAELDNAFFTAAATDAVAVNLSAYSSIEKKLEAIIQECETTKNQFVDGVPRSMMNLVLSPKYYGEVRDYLDKQTNNANINTAAEEFYTWHGVRTQSCVHLPVGCDCLLLVDGAVAQPVMSNPYTAEKIPLSEAYGVSIFYHYGTKVVTPDLIFKPGTFTAVAAGTTFDATKTYYTLSDGVYTVAEIVAFAEGVTYYTMA